MDDLVFLKNEAQAVGFVLPENFSGEAGEQRLGRALLGSEAGDQGTADFGRKILQAITGSEAWRQAVEQGRNSAAAFPRHRQQAEDRQYGVTRHQRRQHAPILCKRRTDEETAIRLKANDGGSTVGNQLLDAGDDVGRADARTQHLGETATGLDRRIGADRRHHALCAKVLRAQYPHEIAAKPAAVLIAEQWPIAVAVGRQQGVETVFSRPKSGLFNVGRAHRFGINRHELIGAAKRCHLSTKTLQQVGQKIAGDARMFVETEVHAG